MDSWAADEGALRMAMEQPKNAFFFRIVLDPVTWKSFSNRKNGDKWINKIRFEISGDEIPYVKTPYASGQPWILSWKSLLEAIPEIKSWKLPGLPKNTASW